MKLTQHFKRILSALLVVVLVFSLMPVTALAADTSDFQTAAIFFSDVHGIATDMTPVLSAINATGVSYETVGLVGDTFSETVSGTTTGMTSTIKGVLNNNVEVCYAWGHDDAGSNIPSNSGLLYSGDHYYIYHISDKDMRPATGTASVAAAISAFEAAAASMDKTKVLFIMSHLPLHATAGDNLSAITWYNSITQIANTMDVVFFWGHNHSTESLPTSMDQIAYYVSNGGSIRIPNGGTRPLNFTYMNAGYIDGEGSTPGRLGVATTVKLYANTMVFQDYTASGEYNTANAHNVTVTRKFAPKPHEHTYDSQTTAATCTQDGSTIYTCSCGHSYTETIPAKGHNYTSNITEATCTEDGHATHTCSVCGDAYEETLSATGHNFTTMNFDPTCTEEGSVITMCANCGISSIEFLPATGHNLVTTTVDPTCTTVGYTTISCTLCNYSETTPIPMAEHSYKVHHKTEATCTSIGYTTYACDTCGYKKNAEYISALGHTYQTETVAPTCTEKGYTAHVCSTCGDTSKENYVAATGHSNNVTVTDPTCTELGYSTYTCTVCGEVTVGDYVKAAGHRYNCVQSGDQLIYTCKICDDSYSITVEPDYIYTKSSRLESDENYVITLYSNKKYYALSHKNDRISAVPVEVSNNRVISAVSEDLLWTHNDDKLSYESDGITYYLNASSTKLSISISKASSVVYSGSKMRVGTNYMRYASNTITLNKSATTAYLFMQNYA